MTFISKEKLGTQPIRFLGRAAAVRNDVDAGAEQWGEDPRRERKMLKGLPL